MTNEFTIQGTVLSKVPCENQRLTRARELNKDVSEIPLTYGSVRIGVNILRVENTTYSLQKYNSKEYDEERYILEISYKYNTEINDGKTLQENHTIINSINEGKTVILTMDNTFTSKKHNVKLIRPRPGYVIKSYFTKAWAESIIKLNGTNLIPSQNLDVSQCFSKIENVLNRELTFS